MRYSLALIHILFFNYVFSQDVQQVEVLKNDKQVTELFDQIGDSEIKLDVIDFLTQPALNIGYEKWKDIQLNFNPAEMLKG